MRAIYNKPISCLPCIDLFPEEIDAEACQRCKKINSEEVSVLEYGCGIFGSKCVIAHDNGKIETVPVSSVVLKIV